MAKLIGTGNNQVPTNGMLGGMAFQSPEDVQVDKLQEEGYNVVTQQDIGTAPNQVPINGFLGSLAYLDSIQGIDFSPSTGTGTATSNILDDYEEGTWTPIITNINSNPTFNATPNNTTGYYIKVGSKVTAWYYSSTFNVASNGSGAAIISGFPFNSTNQTNSYAPGIMTHTNCFSSDVENGYFSLNNNYFVPTINNSTGSTTWTTGATVYFMVSVTYWAA
jgi:hypothetical protein